MKKAVLQLYGFLKKDSLLLIRRRKYLYLFILLPLIIASLFLFALNPKEYSITVGVCDFDETVVSKQAFSNLRGFESFVVSDSDCVSSLIQRIQAGEFDVGLEIGEGFSDNIENLDQSKIVVYFDNTDIAFANLLAWKVDSSLEPFKRQIIDSLNQELQEKVSAIQEGISLAEKLSPASVFDEEIVSAQENLDTVAGIDTEFLTNPIWTDKRPIYDAGLQKDSGITYIFPILALFIILMMASTSIIYDKNTNYLTRVKSSSSVSLYLVAKLIFFTALVFVQFAIILLLFMLYGSAYAINIFAILKLVLMVGVTNTLLGLIIGLISKSEGIAVLFSLMISFPLMLLSGIFFPTQTLPTLAQWSSSILPLSSHIDASKTVLLFGQTITNTWIYFAIVLFVITWWMTRKG